MNIAAFANVFPMMRTLFIFATLSAGILSQALAEEPRRPMKIHDIVVRPATHEVKAQSSVVSTTKRAKAKPSARVQPSVVQQVVNVNQTVQVIQPPSRVIVVNQPVLQTSSDRVPGWNYVSKRGTNTFKPSKGPDIYWMNRKAVIDHSR